MKKHASDKTVRAFCEAVYPESTDLALTVNGEEEILAEATRLIVGTKAELAELREAVKAVWPYIHENDMEGESEFEKAWMHLESMLFFPAALAEIDTKGEGK